MTGIPRAFIALPLPGPVLDAAEAAQRALGERLAELGEERALRSVPRDNIHLTLRFLGGITGDQLRDISDGLAQAAAEVEPFQYEMGGVIALPSPARLRVAALAVKPCQPLSRLAALLEESAVAAGLPAENRPFRPHVTIARTRGRRRRPPRLPGDLPAADLGAEAREVIIFRSERGEAGPVYEPVLRAALGTGTLSRAGEDE